MAKKRKTVEKPLDRDGFLTRLQSHATTFAKGVSTNEGDWIIKGFIDIYRGNTKNVGSVNSISDLVSGSGPFSQLGEDVYDDYWMFYLTRDMAQTFGVPRPYTNLKTYAEYKQRGIDWHGSYCFDDPK